MALLVEVCTVSPFIHLHRMSSNRDRGPSRSSSGGSGTNVRNTQPPRNTNTATSKPISSSAGSYPSTNSNNNGLRNNNNKTKQNQRSTGTAPYRSTNGKWTRNEQPFDSSVNPNDRYGRARQPRHQRPALPQTDPDNPFVFEVSDYDLALSAKTMEEQFELYSGLVVDPDIMMKFQALTIIAQQSLYKQQQNYNEFMEDKRQHEIERWLANMSEEDRRQYLERTKLAGSRFSASTTISSTTSSAAAASNAATDSSGEALSTAAADAPSSSSLPASDVATSSSGGDPISTTIEASHSSS